MIYSFNTDRSGQRWTDDDLRVLAEVIQRDVEAFEREREKAPETGRTNGSSWWSYSFFSPSDETVAEVAKLLRRPPGAIKTKMLQMSDEFYVDHGHLEKANRAWQRMGRATKKQFVEHQLESIQELSIPSMRIELRMEAQEIPSPDQFSERKFVDEAVRTAKREAQEQALAFLEAHAEQADNNLNRRIKALKRQLGIRQTAEEMRAATRERVRQHRQRKQAQNPVWETSETSSDRTEREMKNVARSEKSGKPVNRQLPRTGKETVGWNIPTLDNQDACAPIKDTAFQGFEEGEEDEGGFSGKSDLHRPAEFQGDQERAQTGKTITCGKAPIAAQRAGTG
jgi:hypothetical protein